MSSAHGHQPLVSEMGCEPLTSNQSCAEDTRRAGNQDCRFDSDERAWQREGAMSPQFPTLSVQAGAGHGGGGREKFVFRGPTGPSGSFIITVVDNELYGS